MKKICFIFLMFLCGCQSMSRGSVSVKSDLSRVQDKNIFYDLKDSSITAARVNKVIQKNLKKKGWKIIKESENAKYSYTIITDIKIYKNIYAVSDSFGNAHLQYETYSYPFVFINILENKTRENIYEATITLDMSSSYSELPEITSSVSPYLFLEHDMYRYITCESYFDDDKLKAKCFIDNFDIQ